MISIDGKHSNYILSLSWNWMGNQILTTAKDRKVRIFDPRSNAMVSEVEADKSAKGSLATWLGKRDQIFTVGFSQNSERVFKMYDPKNMSAPIIENTIDIASSVLVPHYDEDTSIMYLAGRGDSTIRYYEINDEAPNVHYINTFSSAVQRATCMLPKIACNSSVCEITRFYKVFLTFFFFKSQKNFTVLLFFFSSQMMLLFQFNSLFQENLNSSKLIFSQIPEVFKQVKLLMTGSLEKTLIFHLLGNTTQFLSF